MKLYVIIIPALGARDRRFHDLLARQPTLFSEPQVLVKILSAKIKMDDT